MVGIQTLNCMSFNLAMWLMAKFQNTIEKIIALKVKTSTGTAFLPRH